MFRTLFLGLLLSEAVLAARVPTPSNVNAVQTESNYVLVRWDRALPDVTYYVYRSNRTAATGYSKIATTTMPYFYDPKALVDKVNYYRIVGVKSGMTASYKSAAVAITYRMNRSVVRGAYFVGNDVTVIDSEWKSKYQTLMAMLREIYRRLSINAGKGDRTFNLLYSDMGLPAATIIFGSQPTSAYSTGTSQDWSNVNAEIAPRFDLTKTKVAVMTKGAPSLGGGSLALTGDELALLGRTVDEQLQIFCDKTPAPPNEYDSWHLTRGELASIRIGGMAHELGHTFGLSHGVNSTDIMTAGFWGVSRFFVGPECNRSPMTTINMEHLNKIQATPFFN